MSKIVIGAQLFTVHGHTNTIEDVAKTFEKIAKIGYTAIQISAFGPVDPKEVAKLARESGLKVASTHIAWDRFVNDLDAVIEEHKEYDCQHPAGGIPQELLTEDGIKQFADLMGPIAEKLAVEGMDFSYHNHDFELVRIGDTTWLEAMYDRISPDHVKAELDMYWLVAGGADPIAWINKCAGREPVVHFKDMTVVGHRQQRFAEIGEGNLNWPGIIKACEAGGVEYALVEQDDCYGGDPFEALALSYRNLKAMGLS